MQVQGWTIERICRHKLKTREVTAGAYGMSWGVELWFREAGQMPAPYIMPKTIHINMSLEEVKALQVALAEAVEEAAEKGKPGWLSKILEEGKALQDSVIAAFTKDYR